MTSSHLSTTDWNWTERLSRVVAWWLRLGIDIERIAPGQPQQNDRHERMHLTPAEIYTPSARPYRGLQDLEYPFHDHTLIVTRCGRICLDSRKINLSTVFAGQKVGLKQVADQVWLVSFMRYDSGYFDNETCRVESAENPFGAKVLPMCPEWTSRNGVNSSRIQ